MSPNDYPFGMRVRIRQHHDISFLKRKGTVLDAKVEKDTAWIRSDGSETAKPFPIRFLVVRILLDLPKCGYWMKRSWSQDYDGEYHDAGSFPCREPQIVSDYVHHDGRSFDVLDESARLETLERAIKLTEDPHCAEYRKRWDDWRRGRSHVWSSENGYTYFD